MKFKIKGGKGAVIAAVIIAALALSAAIVGGQRKSAVCIGYVGNSFGSHWQASYSLFDGYMTKTVKPSDGVITADISTEEGSFDIIVTDGDEEIYSATDVGTATIEIPAEGRVKLKLTGNGHKGSFDINW